MADVCKVCGCTDDNPCITEEGPCHWIIKGLCSACYIEIPPGETCYKDNIALIVPKACRCCANLEEDKEAQRMGFKNYHHCIKGKFDEEMPDGSKIRGSFAWSGICRPNKVVAKAQRHCLFWGVHPRYKAEQNK